MEGPTNTGDLLDRGIKKAFSCHFIADFIADLLGGGIRKTWSSFYCSIPSIQECLYSSGLREVLGVSGAILTALSPFSRISQPSGIGP